MRLPRSTLLFVLVAALAVGAAGCGGQKISADEIPGGAQALTVPEDRQAPAAAATATPDGSTSTSTSSSTSTDSSPASGGTGDQPADGSATTGDGTSTGGTDTTATPQATATPAPAGDGTGGTAPDQPQQDPTQNGQAPPAGSDEQRFEDFCNQNAGAC